MGDAVLGIFIDGDSAVKACFGIAKDLDGQCEYISDAQSGSDHAWAFSPGGPSIKIAVEFGLIDISTIMSRFLGEHRRLIGSPINYAARISAAGDGNRWIIGPVAAKRKSSTLTLLRVRIQLRGNRASLNTNTTYFHWMISGLKDLENRGKRRIGGKCYYRYPYSNTGSILRSAAADCAGSCTRWRSWKRWCAPPAAASPSSKKNSSANLY